MGGFTGTSGQDKSQGGGLYKHLRQGRKKRKKQYGSKDKRGQVRNRASIDDRPAAVEQKARIGDWEAGTMAGKNHQGALVAIVDRVSKSTPSGRSAASMQKQPRLHC